MSRFHFLVLETSCSTRSASRLPVVPQQPPRLAVFLFADSLHAVLPCFSELAGFLDSEPIGCWLRWRRNCPDFAAVFLSSSPGVLRLKGWQAGKGVGL